MRTVPLSSIALVLACLATAGLAAPSSPTFTDPKDADADFAFQGEYTGAISIDGQEQKRGAQVIALGKGKFRGLGFSGGLPGDGWDELEKVEVEGERKGDAVHFATEGIEVKIQGGKLQIINSGGQTLGTLDKVDRKSSTLGAKPPAGAVVLFDGSNADNFKGGRLTEDGLLMQGVTSKQRFNDCTCHLEFLLPYMPEARGQGRGNSGFYVQGRYEIQMLDSFGLEGKDNECGGIYNIAPPRINMCYPPLAWQTYDVDFKSAVFDDGKKVENARITVRHNGVVIHDDVELSGLTKGGVFEEEGPEPGPIYLQDHGNPVRYRNIWVLEK